MRVVPLLLLSALLSLVPGKKFLIETEAEDTEESDPVSEPGSGDNPQLPALETFEEPNQMKPKNRGFCGRRVRGSRVQESRGQKKKKYN